MTPLRVLIASDHEIVRSGLRELLKKSEMLDVAGLTDTDALVASYRDVSPDVVLLEVSRPASGLPAVARLHQAIPQARVVVLSANENVAFVRAMLASGARAYILKDALESELYHALKLAARGHRYLDPRLSDSLSDLLLGTAGEGIGRPHTKRLSRRETEVLRAIARGFTGREIGQQFGLSEKTVQTYRARIYEKLELHSRADLVHYALAHGLGWEDSF